MRRLADLQERAVAGRADVPKLRAGLTRIRDAAMSAVKELDAGKDVDVKDVLSSIHADAVQELDTLPH